VFEMVGVLVFVIIASLFGISQLVSSVRVIVALGIMAILVAQLPIFSQSMYTFQERLVQGGGSANVYSGTSRNIGDRLDFAFSEAVNGVVAAPQWYGNGMGLGSNVAAVLVYGSPMFIGGEGVLGRTIFEFGPLFGVAFISFRVVLGIFIAIEAFARMRHGQVLAWLFVPMLLNEMIFGVLEQPTAQGFLVITLGICVAALNLDRAPAGFRTTGRSRSFRALYPDAQIRDWRPRRNARFERDAGHLGGGVS